MIVSIDEKLFLNSFDEFERVIVPIENKARSENGKPALNEDEITNLFLSMRKHYGISEDTSKNSQ
jgi:hypothetical protein